MDGTDVSGDWFSWSGLWPGRPLITSSWRSAASGSRRSPTWWRARRWSPASCS